MTPWYNVRKAAQVAAFFSHAEGGNINVLKLVKLVYLADRLFMEKYDSPILQDRLVSMDHGPVNSITLDYINGYQSDPRWDDFIVNRAGYQVGLARPELDIEDLDELSDAEIGVLKELWNLVGHMDQYQLRDYTHEHCLEWEDPEGTSIPIPHVRVFNFLGKKDSKELAEKVKSERMLDHRFRIG